MSPNSGVYLERPWRVGRKVKRHIYAMVDNEPSNDDTEIAVAVGPEAMAEVIAHTIVEDHNRVLEWRQEREGWSGLEHA